MKRLKMLSSYWTTIRSRPNDYLVARRKIRQTVVAMILIASCASVDTVLAVGSKLEWRALDATPKDKSCKAVLFEQPNSIAIDRDGNIYISNEKGVDALQKISPAGTIVTVLSRQSVAPEKDQYFGLSLAIDGMNRVIVGVRSRGTIERLGDDGRLTLLAGQPGELGFINGPPTSAKFKAVAAVAISRLGDIAVADSRTIRQLAADGSVATIAGGAQAKAKFLDGQGSRAVFGSPNGIVFDSSGNLYVADGGVFENEGRSDYFGVIRRVDHMGLVTTLAGDSNAIGGHLDGTGTAAMLSVPSVIAIDSAGNLYFSDVGVGQSVRKMDPEGRVTSLIYHVARYDEPSDRDGTDPVFMELAGIAVDRKSNIYVVDKGANKLHKIDPVGVVTTLCELSDK